MGDISSLHWREQEALRMQEMLNWLQKQQTIELPFKPALMTIEDLIKECSMSREGFRMRRSFDKGVSMPKVLVISNPTRHPDPPCCVGVLFLFSFCDFPCFLGRVFPLFAKDLGASVQRRILVFFFFRGFFVYREGGEGGIRVAI